MRRRHRTFWGCPLNKHSILSLSAALFFSAAAGAEAWAAVQSTEQVSYPAAAADHVVVENDFGRVRVQAWDRNEVQATIRRIAGDAGRLSAVDVLKQKAGSRIYFRAFFYDYRNETVELDLRVPRGVGFSAWGANPSLELEGLEGPVWVQTQTGSISAVNLAGAVSLLSTAGNVDLRLSRQPRNDLRVESRSGSVTCTLSPELNLRAWLRAGDALSWNREVEFQAGHLERQLGVGGPLLYLGSLNGKVEAVLNGAEPLSVRAEPPPPPPPLPPAPDSEPERRDAPQRRDYPPDRPQDPGNRGASGEGEVLTQTDDGAYTLKVDVNWTRLNASVRDIYTSRSVPDLRRDDFLVYEDGRLQRVETFQSTEAPFDLLLLLDVSGSTKAYIDLIKEASIQFTREIKPNDRIAVAVFNSRVRLIQPFTNNRREVARSIDRIQSRGGTAFYDALDTSLNEYVAGREGRRAIVVFTDGVDNQLTGDYSDGSRISFRDLFRSIQETETIIYTIFLDTEERRGRARRQPPRRSGGSLGDVLGDILSGGRPNNPLSDPEAYREARRQLQEIADQTGGRMYSPTDIYDLDRVYSEIADDLRIQYTLVYSSTNPVRDGSWRDIRVEIRNRRDLVVRTRRGYYATP